jgi:hypothetical protein
MHGTHWQSQQGYTGKLCRHHACDARQQQPCQPGSSAATSPPASHHWVQADVHGKGHSPEACCQLELRHALRLALLITTDVHQQGLLLQQHSTYLTGVKLASVAAEPGSGEQQEVCQMQGLGMRHVPSLCVCMGGKHSYIGCFQEQDGQHMCIVACAV